VTKVRKPADTSPDVDGSSSVRQRRIRIRKDDAEEPPTDEIRPASNGEAQSKRPAEESPESKDGDLDAQLKMTLDLSDPEPREYEASDAPPRVPVDTIRWLWWAMGVGVVTCPLLLAFQLVFTDPAHGANVLAVVITMSFGALFATWTFEYWLRRGSAEQPTTPPIWTLTRHAVLAFAGVAAMAVAALNSTASFGLFLLVVFTLVVADIVLRRVRVK
jgi:hypothetical protein